METQAYLYKSNGGKALGWVNEKQELDKKMQLDLPNGDAVLYVIKATNKAMSYSQNDCDEVSWSSQAIKIFQKYIGKELCHNNDEPKNNDIENNNRRYN